MSHNGVAWVTASDGVRLAVYAQGDPEKPTVLAVHGYPDDHTVWDDVLAALVERYQVVSYDVRGAGSSAPRTDVRATASTSWPTTWRGWPTTSAPGGRCTCSATTGAPSRGGMR